MGNTTKRVTLTIGRDAWEELKGLAGGERKVGAWLTANVGQLAAWEKDAALARRMREDVAALLRNPYDA